MDCYHGEPFQERRHPVTILLSDLIMKMIYHPHKARLHIVAVGIGEEALQVPLNNPCCLGVAVAHLADVFDNLVNRSLRPHLLAVVERSRVQRFLNPWFQRVAKNMICYAAGKLGCENFSPFRDRCEKGVIVENAKGPLSKCVHHTNKQRCPVGLKGYRITPVTLILPGGEHHAQ